MNFVQKKRKRVTAQQQKDYLDFNRINVDPGDNQSNNHNEFSFTTRATRGNSAAKQSSTYLSITSGRGYAHGEVGIVYIDIESPAISVIQLSDDPWYSGLLMKINIIDPCRVIVPHTVFEARPETSEGKLIKFIRDEFPKLEITKVPRRHFSETNGFELVKKYCSDKYNYVKEEIANKYYALSAASGLLKYLQFIHNIYFKENSLKLEFETKFAHMQIDIDTSYKLELLPQRNPNTVKSNYPSLFSVLDYCVTSLGKRTLRARILEPMCDIPSINDIHDCIAELNMHEQIDLIPLLIAVLRNFNNVERLHKLVMVVPQEDNIRAAEILINQALHLRKCLRLVPELQSKLSPLMCRKFEEIKENLFDERYASMLKHIDTVINKNLLEFQRDSSSQLFQRMHCIQSGVNDLIDILRKTYDDLVKQLEVLVGDMSAKYGHAFKVNYSVQRGFHIILTISHKSLVQEFPDELEVLEIKRNTCFLNSAEVNKLNIRLQTVIEEITMQSNVVIAVMLNDIVKEIDAIYDLSGFTATLDIILSFAAVSAADGFVCPTFGDEMRVVNAVHPILDQNIHRTVATPNNVIATPEYNFFIITGPNMSGKTVYIKMIAVLQIMAQLGCYVPAHYAQFRITDRIFSRMGFNDSLEKNLSTFMMEMNNMEHILKNVTPNSMVVIDELCRSTNPKEGVQLAWNMCEHLASIRGLSNDGKYFLKEDIPTQTQGSLNADDNASKAPASSIVGPVSTTTRTSTWRNAKLNAITAPFIFLTTHFLSLTKLVDQYFNVVNLSLSAEEVNENGEQSMSYNHRIQEGVTRTTSYGLALAKTVRFTSDILNQALELHMTFLSGENTQMTNQGRPNRVLSNVGRQLVRFNRNSDFRAIDEVSSVVSAVLNAPHAVKRRLRFPSGSLMDASISTSCSDYENHLKVDRIMYNAYGDLMSKARITQIDLRMQYNYDDHSGLSVHAMQNDAIRQFLVEFTEEQQSTLMEAVANLRLSQEMSEIAETDVNINNDRISPRRGAPVISTPKNNVEAHQTDGSELSSIISIQIPQIEMPATKFGDVVRTHPCSDTFVYAGSNMMNEFYEDQPTGVVEVSSDSSGSTISSHGSEFDSFQSQLTNANQNFNFSPASDSSSEFNGFDPYDTDINTKSSPTMSAASVQSRFFAETFEPFDQFMVSQSCASQPSCSNWLSNSNLTQVDASGFVLPSPNTSTFSAITSQANSQSHRQRPNLSNIKKSPLTSQSFENVAYNSDFGSNPFGHSSKTSSGSLFHFSAPGTSTAKRGSSNPSPLSLKGSFESSSTFQSGDGHQSSDGEQKKLKRKFAQIPKKSKMPSSIFGDTTKLFPPVAGTSAQPKTEAFAANPTAMPNDIRTTDTNYTETMKRLQKIIAKRNAKTDNVTIPQNMRAEQATPRDEDAGSDTSSDIVPPPPQFN